MIIEKIRQIWKARDLRNKILFVLGMLVIFRLVAHIPVPGVDTAALKQLFNSNQVLGLMDLFSGGGMSNFSIVMMGVGPYITSSIIFQLLGMIVPKIEEMQKEESGRQKINMWTRWATVPLAIMQAYAMINLLERSARNIIISVSSLDLVMMVMTVTVGTMFLMWLGELISEKKIGNGISLIIFAGIIAALPQVLSQILLSFDKSQLFTLIGFVAIAIVTVVGVVIINEGQRNIPVQYARQIRGGRTSGGTNTHLPLRVNMAGVIPIIFAISIIMFPSMVAQFFLSAKTVWIANFSQWTINIFQNQLFYGIIYFLLVFAFTYFYTEIVFHPDQIAENLQKQGGFVPGIRPGRHTTEYLGSITHKIILVGALFLGLIAVLPLVMRYFTGIQSLAIGGTSLLIVVSVVIDTVKQIQSQMTMREYDGV
ncbi:preprotein translocase subunit SecY [Candidatus Falkowbacteria bacterium CG_4_10_14_0_2_um_filter_41_15]|uniref:Protein translocase subunit SecY n=4 Tax=Candidatus Falkowiibacteriota TaxID=1752728 RepID=A0A2G9ZMD7_9BACT|nr:MAG: preprotein translocase subunit SecY [Candidatus Falkowbacteria bacterium CG1_02_41_21]PIP34304.1 MAG: preprotein translocase subunit SecY [Candidatus Falkowbacteria bacterium CG23_combo_of_CG06-09_8_20_14_all_41_10]PIZ11076.1 MAG: preprotein translocase subunit SecY [Candidatus Falkowbacteria bacterium CG_4_10_14_0_8_um_filter_41_36]PJA10064.1 MAG: preprotein translocase subunit SecY [Candidatus Falkowbacteria bacterium CG_4_10_14_0_2_um_filter_41_15]